MATKVKRYEIIKPLNLDITLYKTILRDIQCETQKAMNKATQMAWEWSGFSNSYIQISGQVPSSREILKYTLEGYINNKIKHECKIMNSGNLSATLRLALDRWKTDKDQIAKGEISIASFKKDLPIIVKKAAIKLSMKDSKYIAKLSLVSDPGVAHYGIKSGQIEVVLTNKGDKTILNRCISGEYKISASQILYKKGKWFLNLAYSFEPKQEVLGNGTLGVDLGIKYVAYMAIHDSKERAYIEGGEIEQYRKQVERRRNELLRAGKYCGEGRVGHGIKTRIRPLENARARVANATDTFNHKYSKFIVEFAVRNKCGCIQMEDLSGISKDDRNSKFLKNWSYFDLQTKIEYKAKEKGITVVKISPKYTSQRCNHCGNIDSDNRKEQEHFECTVCGHKANADYNAAQNIATPGITEMINEYLAKGIGVSA